DPDMGATFLVQAFVVIVIGGLGSYPGAVVGGIIAGEIVSITSAFDSAYSDVMLYAVMALILVLRPQGLFGAEGRV
ncbi:MAG: ABC transporter permease subunit, partial [Acetobacteraceae bacterium]